VALLFAEVHRQIDWSRGYESLDKESQQVVREAESGRRYVDKFVKVWTKDDVECWVLIHVDVKSPKSVRFTKKRSWKRSSKPWKRRPAWKKCVRYGRRPPPRVLPGTIPPMNFTDGR